MVMPVRMLMLSAVIAAVSATPSAARMLLPSRTEVEAAMWSRSPGYLQCVPYARRLTGIQIYGDAHTWWDQAESRYARGFKPRPGAVMAFKPSGNSVLGHVAAVSKVIDRRTILISHANWSPIGGQRGQIEENVKVVDVSPDNDWSAVRVWYAPLQALGSAHWPVEGFIYPAQAKKGQKGQKEQKSGRTAPRLAAADGAAAKRKPGDPIGDIIRRKLRW